MPICNTLAMNHHFSEISSQVAADAHAALILDRASEYRSRGLVARQYCLGGAGRAAIPLNIVQLYHIWGSLEAGIIRIRTTL